MRVLLPLKKKLNDSNSQEEEEETFQDDESFDSSEDEDQGEEEAAVDSDPQAQAEDDEEGGEEEEEAGPKASSESESLDSTTTTTASLEDAAAVNNSSNLSSPQARTADETNKPTAERTELSTAESSVAAANCVTTKPHSERADHSHSQGESPSPAKEEANETKPSAQEIQSTTEAASKNDERPTSKSDEQTNESVFAAEAQSPTASLKQDSSLAATTTASCPSLSVAKLSASTPPVAARNRKRQSPSPSALLDSKPPSKKARDTKPPAREAPKEKAFVPAAAAAAKSSEAPFASTNNSTIMAGGSRGGRKLWSGGSSSSPSYFVETSAGSGREDVSSSEDGAEVDVRFAYRHDNDPAATGAASIPGARSSSSMAAPSTNNNDSMGKRSSSTGSFHQECGRDDVDVREPDSSIIRPPEGDDHDLFALALKKQGLEMVEQEGDGNCLFRAISLQVYGDASMHGEVRHRCLEFMARDKEHFSQFITDEPFEQYIQRKRQDGVHGNNPEIQAISELFNRPIEVFVPQNGATPLNIFHAEYKTQDTPIRLSYHDGNHYNAVIDPLVPTAGLGLGLPGLQPGLADKMQMAKAVAESDRLADQREYERALEESHNDQLQRAIKESTLSEDNMYQHKALNLSDCDATNFELEQAVLESSLESFRTGEHGRKQASSSSSAGRRKRQASLPQQTKSSHGASMMQSSVASIPSEAREDTGSSPIPGAAAASAASASVAAAPAVASRPSYDDSSYAPQHAAAAPLMAEHYPQTVQELVMNGFELRKVVRAYELVGDNFDNLLGFLMSNSGS